MFTVCWATQVLLAPATAWALIQVVPVPKLVPLMLVQVAPASWLMYTPVAPIAVYSTLGCDGSARRSNASPAVSRETPSPDSRVNVAPPSVLRQTPAFGPPFGARVAATITLPSATTPVTSWPLSCAEPSAVQVVPPSVVRSSPFRTPPVL